MARAMTPDERRAFLLDRPRTAKLGTVRADGRPHVAPVWYALDGDVFVFTTGEDTVKGKALRREPRVSLCVDDETPPYAFVIADGVAEIHRDLDELLRWATLIGARYMGQERGEEFGRRNAVPSEMLVRVNPTRIVARTGISD
jgi:PPOX class probable F420-dependent enzyme